MLKKQSGWMTDFGDAEKPDQNTVRAAAHEVPPPRLAGVRVLLVDDSPDNQRLFQRILVGAGARVDLAENGEVAVRKQSQETYDVIVMDIRMPILDGYQATRIIRHQGYQGPVIALTAHATPGEEERCRASGCSHFQLKPINRNGLVGAVELALNENHTAQNA